MRVRPLTEEAYLRLLRTAKRQAPASLWISKAKVLDVYMREWREAEVVVSGERIAYVGETQPLVDERTVKIDATGYWLVPGYIEPHAHPFQWYNPSSLSDYALQTGTTTMICDTLILYGILPADEVEKIMETLAAHPVKQFFWARLDPQSHKPQNKAKFAGERLGRMISHPLVIQGGELTDWRGILQEDDAILTGLKQARDLGKRIEGHHPGASPDTLNIAAAAGVTACHESIAADEVIHRLRLGMYATLRHSSIRPDLPELVRGLIEKGVPWSSRLMLTSDGCTPPMMRHGFMDYTVRVAIEAGMPPIDAYVTASLTPAVYYGLDAEIGGIAPGRLADLLLLRAPDDPTPVTVIANGTVWAQNRTLCQTPPRLDWSRYCFPDLRGAAPRLSAEAFRMCDTGEAVPVLQMQNAVITRLSLERLPVDQTGCLSLDHDAELAWIALIDPHGKRLTQAAVRGYGRDLEGIASSYTASADWLVIGRDPHAMAAALERLNQLGGGLVMIDQGQIVYELPLPLGGMMSDLPMEDVIERAEEFFRLLRVKGHRHIDPIYSLLFFSATHLPFVRMTAEGVYDVKQGRVISPARTLDERFFG